jgi:uncharacterized protein with NRDE domain
LGTLLREKASDLTAGLFVLLSDRIRPADDLLPATGVGREWEQLLSSAFIASDQYGTRSSTVVLVARDGHIVFEERTFGPQGSPGSASRLEFRRGTGVELSQP